jgi:hypothetical protein
MISWNRFLGSFKSLKIRALVTLWKIKIRVSKDDKSDDYDKPHMLTAIVHCSHLKGLAALLVGELSPIHVHPEAGIQPNLLRHLRLVR